MCLTLAHIHTYIGNVQTGRLPPWVGKRRIVCLLRTMPRIFLLVLSVACMHVQKWRAWRKLNSQERRHWAYRRGCTYALSEPVASSKTRRTYSSAVLSRRSCYVSPDLQFKSGSDHALKGRGHSVVARTIYLFVEGFVHGRNFIRRDKSAAELCKILFRYGYRFFFSLSLPFAKYLWNKRERLKKYFIKYICSW